MDQKFDDLDAAFLTACIMYIVLFAFWCIDTDKLKDRIKRWLKR
jgi:hypothetical protein